MTEDVSDEVGCSTALIVLVSLVGFSAVATGFGIAQTNLWLYFAGLPVSGLISLFGSDLILAWPLDGLLWMSAAWTISTRSKSDSVVRWTAAVIAVALAYGLVLSFVVEPTGSFA